MLGRRQLLQQCTCLPSTGRVAEEQFPPRQSILEMHGGDKQTLAGDRDIGCGNGARLTLSRQRNDPRLVERLSRQDRIPTDGALLPAEGEEEREEVTRRRNRAERFIVPLDVCLKQHDVITRRTTRQPARCEIVDKAREFAAASMHVPRRNGEGNGFYRWGQGNDPGANARACNEKDTEEESGADPPVSRVLHMAVAVFARAADASLAADRSMVADV